MTRPLLILLFTSLLATNLCGQYYTNQNKVWAFGDYAGVDFTSGSPVAFSTSMYTSNGCASVSNAAGSLLFYTEGIRVWNASGTLMPHGHTIVSYSTGGNQSALIVPIPGNPNRFYIFSQEAATSDTGYRHLSSSIVDMTLDGGLGDLVSGSIGVPLANVLGEGMTAVAGTNCDIWVIVHEKDSAVFLAYDIGTGGISSPVVSASGTYTDLNGMIKASPNWQKIVLESYALTAQPCTQLFDFNNTTGVVSNCQVLDSTAIGAYSAEFSPDNTKLYTSVSSTGSIYQYDISLPTTPAIIASKTVISTAQIYTDLKLGPDGKIYFETPSSFHALDCIPYPNNPGTACGHLGYVVVSMIPFFMNGLPNIVITVNPTDTSYASHDTLACLPPSGGITITAHDSLTGSSYFWDNGTTTVTRGGITTAGTYWVNIYNGCHLKIDTIHVTFKAPAGVITGTMSVCPGLTSTLSDTSISGAWSSGSPAIATIGSATGVVTGVSTGIDVVTFTVSSTGCIAISSFTVNPIPNVINGATHVCAGSTTNLSDTLAGGTWASSAPTIAIIGSSTGLVTGVSAGAATITYTSSAGCITTKVITVNALPPAVSGGDSVCAGATMTLTDGTSGGIWTCSNANATVGSASGIIAGVTAGSDSVYYTLSTGCRTAKIITVNPLPSGITGTVNVCTASTTSLSDATPGGTWISGSPAIATIGSSTGVATGVSAGTVGISYVLATGCATGTTITVNASPSVIAGPAKVCVGSTITLSDTLSGGVWSAPTYSGIVSVGSASGIVTGSSTGTAIVTYTLASGCSTTQAITVNPLPSAITGITGVCVGETTTLFDGGGGTWSTGTTGIVTVGSSSGNVTGIMSGGTATITYTLPTGCITTTIVSVSISPTAITGTPSMCVGLTTALSDSVAGGYWTNNNPAITSVNISTGVVTGIALGVDTITYTMLSSGCYTTIPVTVNSSPTAITGTAGLCSGATDTLHDGVSGGTWISGSTGVAAVGSATGIVTGGTGGSATITYSMGPGCSTTFTVNVSPAPSAITGALHVCPAGSTTLSSTTTGGIWSSVSTGIATIGSGSGTVNGVAAGTSVISYANPLTGCAATAIFTVNPLPGSITGSLNVCPATTTVLGDGGGGTWLSGSAGIATIGSTTGLVTGVATGHATITYTLSTGCSTTAVVTVNPLPTIISGAGSVCAGAVTGLTDVTTGGTWSKSNTNITLGSTGIVTGVTAGTTVVSYTLPTGCYVTKTITINALPATPVVTSGTLQVCQGSTITVSDGTGGGTWSTGAGGSLSIGTGSGLVTGLSAGTQAVTYTLTTTGCASSAIVTVNPLPALFTVTGGGGYCAGGSGLHIGLSGSVSGVTYQLYNGGTPVGSALSGTTGALDFGVQTAAGTYTVIADITATGCTRTMTSSATIVINPLPSAISGPSAVCVGSTIAEIDPGGGTWLSSTPTTATIGSSTGSVTGVAIGATTITYTLPTTCFITKTVTVSVSPMLIGGASAVCTADSITLTDGVIGGAWSSGSTGIATVGSSTGVVTGVAAGVTGITYSLGTGCTVFKTISVNATPAAITGSMGLCVGSSTTLGMTTSGGAWSSGATTIATVGSTTGSVTGIAIGTTTITYTLPTTCFITKTVTVSVSPTLIGGASAVCTADSITLTDGVIGGAWNSGSTGIATVGSSTGVVTGVAAGVTSITYSLGTGCTVFKAISVNATPAAITGSMGLCVGHTTTLSSTTTGGAWTSGATTIATVGSTTGIVTGSTAGTAGITYTLATGCNTTATVTVNAVPPAITGTMHVCVGATTALGMTVGGGSWTSGSTGIATVGSTGIVMGVAPGTSLITYSLGSGCSSTATVTVNALPNAITGATQVCAGSSTTLTVTPGGGTWSSSNITVASIGSTTGSVTGVTAGTATISYTLSSGCAATTIVTVNPMPAAITGTDQICVTSSTTLSSTTAGGTWTSMSGIATVGSATGIVTGVTPGTTIIKYTLPTGCLTSTTFTVNAAPVAIGGTMAACVGSTATLSDGTSGGTWSSGATPIATIGSATGVVSAVSLGTAPITYTAGGCAAMATFTVTALPGAISGAGSVCAGSSATLTVTPGGGAWSSNLPGTAAIGSSGTVTGVTAGTATISYSLGAGCTVTMPITVNALPAPPATGTSGSDICIGATTSMSDVTTGGTWISGNMAIATIGSATGIVTGVSGGPVAISYTLPTGCASTLTVSVIAVPPMTGIRNMCAWGDTMTISDANTTGSYSSALVTVTNLGSGLGKVTAFAPGTASVTYTLPSGCLLTTMLTVNPLPGLITGSMNICAGSSTTLGMTTTGGTWSSNNIAVATIGPGTGIVTGIAAGTAQINYTILATGCKADTSVMVSIFPVAGTIAGDTNVCVGNTVTLTDAITGGIWERSNSTASVAAGVVTGASAGMDTISYVVTNACGSANAVKQISIYPMVNAGAITGIDSVCMGASTALSNAATGGVWSCSNGTATVSATGLVTGLSTGMDTVLYTVSNPGCTAAAEMVVKVLPVSECNALGAPPVLPRGEVMLYPNPAQDEITVVYDFSEDGSIEITDMVGRIVAARNLSSQKQKEEINIGNISSGLYLYKVVQHNILISTGKIVKE